MLSHVQLFYHPMDYSLPGSSVHEILQSRIMEWVAISYTRGSFWPRDWTCVFCIGRQILYCWATWEAQDFKVGSPILETNRLGIQMLIKGHSDWRIIMNGNREPNSPGFILWKTLYKFSRTYGWEKSSECKLNCKYSLGAVSEDFSYPTKLFIFVVGIECEEWCMWM